MTAIQTLSGHVKAAIAFLNRDDLWMALARPIEWDISRLTGVGIETFVFDDPDDLDFVFTVNDTEVSCTFAEDAEYSASALATLLQGLCDDEDLPAGTVVATSDKRIRITAPLPEVGYGKVVITTGNGIIGFLTGETGEGFEPPDDGEEPPAPDPLTRRLIEPFGWELTNQLTKTLVIPDPATAATVTGTNRALTFNLSASGNDNLIFLVDDNPTEIEVTFPAGASVSASSIVAYINAAALLVSPDYGAVATLEASTSPPAVQLKSPTKGSSSKIEVTEGNTPLGISGTSMVHFIASGTAGGAIQYRDDRYSAVEEADAYDLGANMVYLTARFPYDEIPLMSYTQIGIVSGIVPKTGFEVRTHLKFSEVEDTGILEFLDHRPKTPRSADTAETIKIVLEL